MIYTLDVKEIEGKFQISMLVSWKAAGVVHQLVGMRREILGHVELVSLVSLCFVITTIITTCSNSNGFK